ncbi:DUF488 family protein [Methanobacterium sp. ACI-7]|uniref:DUF488 domain-containing protein n=1 Tax=unclassified Methanobacterium TaxID=2627676 RepID=UPI0039C30870
MIYTIGHSIITQESFIEILKSFKIQLVVDVRSSPYSKFVPYFNRENIKKALKENNMRYIFLGDYIGGKPKFTKYYKDGKVNYDLIRKSGRYKEGIAKLIELNKNNDLVLMCSEEDPYSCHRHNLITQTLLKSDLEVTHIRKEGKTDRITKPHKEDIQTTLF